MNVLDRIPFGYRVLAGFIVLALGVGYAVWKVGDNAEKGRQQDKAESVARDRRICEGANDLLSRVKTVISPLILTDEQLEARAQRDAEQLGIPVDTARQRLQESRDRSRAFVDQLTKPFDCTTKPDVGKKAQARANAASQYVLVTLP